MRRKKRNNLKELSEVQKKCYKKTVPTHILESGGFSYVESNSLRWKTYILDKDGEIETKKRSITNRITFYIVVIFFLLAMMVFTFGFYYYNIKGKVSAQLYVELEKGSDLSTMLLNSIILDRKENLESIALFCDEPDGSGNENWREAIKLYATEQYRLGVSDMNGRLYLGNEKVVDVSGKDYFRQAIENRETVIEMESIAFDGESGLIFATPIYDGGDTVKGVLCAEYAPKQLGDSLNAMKDESGSLSVVLSKDGSLIASFGDTMPNETFYDVMDKITFDSDKERNSFWSTVAAGQKGFFQGSGPLGGHVALYCRPVGIEGWSMVSLINADYYRQTIEEIRLASLAVAAVEAVLVAGLLFSIIVVLRIVRKEFELQERDFLTNVYSREAAKKILEKELKKRGQTRFGCCFFLDLDDFKQINDTLGHDGGDRALVECAMILKQETRIQDVISRFGGDEFCIWLWEITDREMAGGIAGRIINAFHTKMDVHVSIGITFFAERDDTYDTIVKRADSGLYLAKELGKDRFAFVE